MRKAGAAVIVLGLAGVLAGAWTPAAAFAGEASPVVARVAADDSSRAVAYWRLWLSLRPRVQDGSVPLQKRIEALNAFLANSPTDAWAESPRFEAAQILIGLHQQQQDVQTPPWSSPPPAELPASVGAPAPVPSAPVRSLSERPDWDAARFAPEPPKLLYDVISLAYSAPMGVDAGLARLRWSTFQLHVAAAGFDFNGLNFNYRLWVGLLGLGARFPFGAERRHEVGFLVFPLSVDIYQTTDPDYEWERRQGFGLLHSRLYYRYDFDGVGLEASVAAPLVFGCDDVYDGAPPLMLSFGVAFGRTHAERQ